MIQKIILTRNEKKTLFNNVLRYWDENYFTLTNFQKISTVIKLPVTLVETMALHYENLFSLSTLLDELVFKGGTAVQHYLKPSFQRGSVDLDFNTSIGHPVAIKQAINDVNDHLKQEKLSLEIHGVPYGEFLFEHEDNMSGTLTFNRILPTKLNEFVTFEEKNIQGKKTKIQINYKHSWLPAIQTNNTELKLFPKDYLQSKNNISQAISSVGDLICDKILTLTQIKDFGRERIKDVYDLYSLIDLADDQKYSIATDKLNRIASSEGITKMEILKSAISHLDTMKSLSTQVVGFKSQVAIDGWKIIDDWENSVELLIKRMELNLQN